MVDSLTDEQVEFLFKYFFTESKEEREKMRNDMKKKYESALNDLENVANRLQKLNLQFAELLAKKQVYGLIITVVVSLIVYNS